MSLKVKGNLYYFYYKFYSFDEKGRQNNANSFSEHLPAGLLLCIIINTKIVVKLNYISDWRTYTYRQAYSHNTEDGGNMDRINTKLYKLESTTIFYTVTQEGVYWYKGLTETKLITCKQVRKRSGARVKRSCVGIVVGFVVKPYITQSLTGLISIYWNFQNAVGDETLSDTTRISKFLLMFKRP